MMFQGDIDLAKNPWSLQIDLLIQITGGKLQPSLKLGSIPQSIATPVAFQLLAQMH